MTHCEDCQIAISALLDGELPAADVPAAIDHLLDCPACSGFYRGARGLADLLGETGLARGPAPEAEPAPAAVWHRVERRSGSPLSRLPGWTARAAAAALVAVGAWAALQLGGIDRGTAPVRVVLGERPAAMSDERFVAIAAELLRAAPRYRREMLDVMSTVEREVGRADGPTGGDAPRPAEERVDGETPAGARLPS